MLIQIVFIFLKMSPRCISLVTRNIFLKNLKNLILKIFININSLFIIFIFNNTYLMLSDLPIKKKY